MDEVHLGSAGIIYLDYVLGVGLTIPWKHRVGRVVEKKGSFYWAMVRVLSGGFVDGGKAGGGGVTQDRTRGSLGSFGNDVMGPLRLGGGRRDVNLV